MKQAIGVVALSLALPVCLANSNQLDSSTYSVGSCYEGVGVVFYVNPTPNAPAGNRGLVVALNDTHDNCTGPNNTCFWDKKGSTVHGKKALAMHYFTGADNTSELVALGSAHTEAANAANAYGSGWYLPAQDELATLYYQSHNIANFGAACGYIEPLTTGTAYWTSSQISFAPGYVWAVYFDTGFIDNYVTRTSFLVRPILAF